MLIFFLYDGPGIWTFVTRGVPARVRERVDVAGRRGFAALVSYVRATAAVALVDAVGIGIGLAIVGVPLVIPLSALVFLSAFVPIIGAVLAGTVAVLIALVANGFIAALIVLAIVIGVMQLESHVLQPLLLGRAVRLHPLAVVLAIAAGLIAAGIAGALLAVPLLAVLNAGIKSLLHEGPTDPEEVDVLHKPDDEAPETEEEARRHEGDVGAVTEDGPAGKDPTVPLWRAAVLLRVITLLFAAGVVLYYLDEYARPWLALADDRRDGRVDGRDRGRATCARPSGCSASPCSTSPCAARRCACRGWCSRRGSWRSTRFRWCPRSG